MDRGLKERLLDILKDITPYTKGILIYGSVIKGYADKNSDIDICVIPQEGIDSKGLYEKVLSISADEHYDIVLYSEIPWYLRGEILENNELIYAEDEAELDFWLYKQRKIWTDMKRRQQIVPAAELLERAKSKKVKGLR
jgi:predicted nucleotidyltransferase